jgi:hypothetical protein
LQYRDIAEGALLAALQDGEEIIGPNGPGPGREHVQAFQAKFLACGKV